jgi:hypothetical protein
MTNPLHKGVKKLATPVGNTRFKPRESHTVPQALGWGVAYLRGRADPGWAAAGPKCQECSWVLHPVWSLHFFFFLAVLEFELRTSWLLSRCSTAWATASALAFHSYSFFTLTPRRWERLCSARRTGRQRPWAAHRQHNGHCPFSLVSFTQSNKIRMHRTVIYTYRGKLKSAPFHFCSAYGLSPRELQWNAFQLLCPFCP